MVFIKLAIFLLFSCGQCMADVVIPRPIVDIEDVTSYAITVNWTIPKNELFREFVIELVPEEGDVLDYDPKDMRRTFTNLTPGTLYKFVVRTVRDEKFSDPVEILQDTIPLPPTDLQLRYFDTLVLTLEGPYFGDTEFTVETSGIEANWQNSIEGVSECSKVILDPNDGNIANPQTTEDEVVEKTMRQFINLVPGKTYKVSVATATCGDGHRGELLSDFIQADIVLPPAIPPVIEIEKVSTTTAELSWDKDPIDGFYDDFEVISADSDKIITVKTPMSPTTLGRNLTNLEPCTKYDLDVYSLYNGKRSDKPQSVVVYTKPDGATNLIVEDFTETTITLSWEGPNRENIAAYRVLVSPGEKNLETSGTTVTIEDLQPGVSYTVQILSICKNEYKTTSDPTNISQTTKPAPPKSAISDCPYIGSEKIENDPYDLVPWEAPDTSLITLSWEKPASGSWDGFIVHFSPSEFEQGLASHSSPQFFGARDQSVEISIPISGKVITASVRSVSNNIASEPVVKRIVCGGPKGESTLRCRNWLFYWNIKITPIDDDARLLIEIPSFPIFNATISLGDPHLVFYNNSFVIDNPCPKSQAKITVYPQCPESLPFCPTIVRPICQHRGSFKDVLPNACCHNTLYNTNEEVCCHNKVINLVERSTEECCVTKWFNRQTQTCCGKDSTSGGLC